MAGRKKHSTNHPIDYRRPEVKVRVPKPNYEYDHELAEELLLGSLQGAEIAKASPNGTCYGCGKKIPPMRKLCGKCNSEKTLFRRR